MINTLILSKRSSVRKTIFNFYMYLNELCMQICDSCKFVWMVFTFWLGPLVSVLYIFWLYVHVILTWNKMETIASPRDQSQVWKCVNCVVVSFSREHATITFTDKCFGKIFESSQQANIFRVGLAFLLF